METPVYLNLNNVFEFLISDEKAMGKHLYGINAPEGLWVAFPKAICPWPVAVARCDMFGGVDVVVHTYELPAQTATDGLKWTADMLFYCAGEEIPFAQFIYGMAPDGGFTHDVTGFFTKVLAEHHVVDPIPAVPGLVTIKNEGHWRRLRGVTTRDASEACVEFCLRIVLFAINLAHCKNVMLEDRREPRAERRRKQRAGVAEIVWKTLRIEPIIRQTRPPSEVDGESRMSQALHICRGHFKTFDEKPLFGKIKGQFWWSQQWRGKLNRGLVVKDYELVPAAGRHP